MRMALLATMVVTVLAFVAAAYWINEARERVDAEVRESESLAAAARHERDRLVRLADIQRLKDLDADAARLWPAGPEVVAGLEAWLEKARALVARLPEHRARHSELVAQSGSPEGAWQLGVESEIVAGLERLASGDARWSPVTIASLERRLDFAKTVVRRTIEDERAKWTDAITDVRASEEFGGLVLAPQVGLVPLAMDESSGLWEFLLVQSGDRPQRGDDGRIVPAPEMGIVLVLIPGGSFTMGSPESETAVGRYKNEGPQHEITLDPYFISKYEVTQAQWERLAGENPSYYKTGASAPLRPVEQVSFSDCVNVLARYGLELPTEAQWERAARGGTTTAWWTGDAKESFRGAGNIADGAAGRKGAPWPSCADWPDLDDGQVVTGPVGFYKANPFGLHDTGGNVWEWCRDGYGAYSLPVREGDGWREAPPPIEVRIVRGGSFGDAAVHARSANRYNDKPDARINGVGVRPVMRIRPD